MAVLEVMAALVALAVLGRMAGGWMPGWWSKAASPLIGIGIGYLAAGPGWHLVGAAVAGWLGEKPGVGWPRGYIEHGIPPSEIDGRAVPEGWQPEWSWHEPYHALALRGVIWGLPFLPLAWWAHGYLVVPLAYAVGMPAAAAVSAAMPEWEAFTGRARRWGWSEALQQVIAAGIILAWPVL